MHSKSSGSFVVAGRESIPLPIGLARDQGCGAGRRVEAALGFLHLVCWWALCMGCSQHPAWKCGGNVTCSPQRREVGNCVPEHHSGLLCLLEWQLEFSAAWSHWQACSLWDSPGVT